MESFKKHFSPLTASLKRFIREEDGVGVVEIILILIVLISLVLIFKDKITDLVEKLLDKVVKNSNQV